MQKFCENRFSNLGDNIAYLCTLVWLLDKNQPTDLRSSRWHSGMHWMIGMAMGALKSAMICDYVQTLFVILETYTYSVNVNLYFRMNV